MRKSTILQSKENEIYKKDRRQNLSFSIGTIPEGSGGIVPHIVPNIVPIIVPIELQKRSFCIAVGKENSSNWDAVKIRIYTFLPHGFDMIIKAKRLTATFTDAEHCSKIFYRIFLLSVKLIPKC